MDTIPQAQESLSVPITSAPIFLYAGFWRRVAASFIDGAVLFVVQLVVLLILFVLRSIISATMSGNLASLTSILLMWFYYAYMESSLHQATIGKKLVGIKVTDLQGNRISFGRATGRTFAKILSLAIFFIGYLMVAFTARSQGLHDMMAGTVVTKEKEVPAGKVATMAILAGFLPMIIAMGISFYIILLVVGQALLGNLQVVTTTTPSGKVSTITLVPEGGQAKASPQPVVMTEADYDKLLLNKLTGFDEPYSVNVGPAVFKLAQFWATDKENPSVWVEVNTIPIPNLTMSYHAASVTINHVWDKNGNELYNPQSSFEQPIFQSINLSSNEGSTPHLSAIRDVHLKPGTQEQDIAKVEGTLTLFLPVNIQTLSFTKNDIGIAKTVGDSQVVIKEIKGNNVLFTYAGKGENFLQMRGYDKDGKELDFAGGSYPGSGQVYDKNNSSTFNDIYKGEVSTLKTIVASSISARTYPFTITK